MEFLPLSGTFVLASESESNMSRQLLARIATCFLCGVVLIFVFQLLIGILLEPLCEECWPGESPPFVWVLPFAVLPFFALVICVGNEDWSSWIRGFSLTSPGPQPRNLQLGPLADASRVLPSAGSYWWLEPAVWVGTFLLLLGVASYLGARHWVATHAFVAFDAPVNFTDGHLSTGNFYINLEAEYSIEVTVYDTHLKKANCQNGWARDTGVKMRWNLYRDNQLLGGAINLVEVEAGGYMYYPEAFWVSGTIKSYTLHASFLASHSGHYNLDVEVLSGNACFDMGKPRVRIYSSTDAYTLTQVFGGMLGITGVTVLLLSIARQVEGPTKKQVGLVLFGVATGPNYFPATPPSPPIFSRLPPFGLFIGLVLIPLTVFLPMVYPKGSIGIPIFVSESGVSAATETPLLVLRLKFNEDSAPFFYLNSKPLSVDELAIRLKEELEHRPNRTVYIQADDDVTYQDVVNAIDMARLWHAKIVLLIPDSSPRLIISQ